VELNSLIDRGYEIFFSAVFHGTAIGGLGTEISVAIARMARWSMFFSFTGTRLWAEQQSLAITVSVRFHKSLFPFGCGRF
jgi:hypothetical protein